MYRAGLGEQIGEKMWKAVFLLIAAVSTAQSLRPPAIPLVSISPSVSIWARGDGVAGQDTTHWSGKPMRLRAALLVDGKPFSIMGDPASFANGMYIYLAFCFCFSLSYRSVNLEYSCGVQVASRWSTRQRLL